MAWASPLRRAFFLALGALLMQTAGAQDYEREARWARDTLATLMVGEALRLPQPGGHRFLALYTRGMPTPKGAVVIAHGRGWGPDHELYGALRWQLAEAGWSTLSIQLPVLPETAKFGEYYPLFPDAGERFAASIDWLRARGYQRIAIASHSLGATMANHYLAESGDQRVGAWVMISLINSLEGMPHIRMPVLDVYGTRDWVGTVYGAGERRALIEKNPGSAQVVIDGAGHFFEQHHEQLARVIAAFLDRTLQ